MAALPADVDVWVRGWVHGNVVTLPGAVVDTGYVCGAADLIARTGSVDRILLTHVHADHAGGVAALLDRWPDAEVFAHPRAKDLVDRWDRRGLWLEHTGQQLPVFPIHRTLPPTIEAGGRCWQVIEAGGHATGGVAFLDPHDGLLITGDALWEDGFGLLVPWFDGPGVFDEADQTLDRLAQTDPAVVIPGHGPPFTDLASAVIRARSRLDYLRHRPDRHRAQVIRNLAAFLRLARPDVDPAPQVQQLRAALGPRPPVDPPGIRRSPAGQRGR